MFGESLVGKTINDNYKIVEEIARGGMAMVYRAQQMSMDRMVAIKILPQEFLYEASSLERFKREAAIVARLEHRAIVPVYDYGEWRGMPYIAMRYLEGGSVDRLLDRGPLDLTTTQGIIRQVASALDYAHSRGVLHRDLKPNNILLDGSGDAFITDFGIARLASSNEQLTATGVVGTPAYMSPEQAQGHELDARSDLYALGIVLFEMLTGRRPFDGETPYSIAVMQVTTQPPSPRDFNPAIPPGVESVVMKAIEKDRDRRFQSATQLAGSLDDADLMPLAETMLHTPPPDYYQSYDQPTPSRPSSPVPPQSWTGPMPSQRRARRPAALVYLGGALFIGVMMGMIVLAGYLLLSSDSEADGPNFVETGVFRLTATADVAQVSGAAGQLLFVSDRDGQPDLYLLDMANGNENRLTATRGAEGAPAISPDGMWMAYVFDPDSSFDDDDGSQSEIFISRLDGSELQQVTSNLAEENSPAWTPDGESLVYIRTVNGGDSYRLLRYDIDTENETTLYEGDGHAQTISVSADGLSLVYAAGDADDFDSWEIFLLSFDNGDPITLTDNDEPDWSPHWHPREQKILFLRAGIGGAALMEMRADGTGQVQIYDGAGDESGPTYAPDGQRILFSSDANLYILVADTQNVQQLTFSGGYDSVWLP